MRLEGIEISVVKGDISETDAEAVVNAANNCFRMGGGVAGVIKRKGGKIIEEEAVCRGPVKVGEAVLTQAGLLRAKYVIHAVTMKMDFKTNEEIVRKATYNTLLCCQKNKIASVAFCALGCGTGKFSYEAASKIMAQEIFKYAKETERAALKKIILVLNSQNAFEIFQKNVAEYIGYIDKKISYGPFLTVDGIVKYQEGIVMIERSNPPFGWALPGGFVDCGESVEEAAAREVKEETSLDFINFSQFKVYSKSNRDARFHTVSVVFAGEGTGVLKAKSDAKGAKVYKIDCLPQKIAFDHREIIEDYFNRLKTKD